MDRRAIVNRANPPRLSRPSPNKPAARAGSPSQTAAGQTASSKPAFAPPPPDGKIIHVEHAVFTSVRSPSGEGYRIAAASPGVRSNEKSEITKHSPSHGGLCGDDPDAVGLSAYPLPTGKTCIAYSRYGGAEHTGRGGQRVVTQIALLDREDYALFECNPVCAGASLAAALVDVPTTTPKPNTILQRLALIAGPPSAPLAAGGFMGQLDALEHLLAAVLTGRRLVIVGAMAPMVMVERILAGVPLSMRPNLTLTVGLKLAPSRTMLLSFIDRDRGETQRVITGHDVAWLDVEEHLEPVRAPEYRTWLELYHRWLTAGRSRELGRLTVRMNHRVTSQALERIATLCNDRDRIDGADVGTLSAIEQRHLRGFASTESEKALLEELLAAISAEKDKRKREQEEKQSPEPSADGA